MQCFLRYNAIAHFVHACSVALAMSNSVTLWTTACQAPLSLGFSRQEYRSGLPCPSPGDLPHPGMEPKSPAIAAVAVFVSQSCPTLGDPMNCSPPGSSVVGILQARTMEWVAISSSSGSFQPKDQTHVSCISCIAGRFLLRSQEEAPNENACP